jgi:hypothetical protein
MTLLLLLLTLQGGWTVRPARPTVGDTVRIVRTHAAPAGMRARVHPLERSDLLEPLEAPTSGYAEGGVTVQYTVAFFAPGRHAVGLPEIELLHPDGRVQTVPADTVFVTVASVLPAEDDEPAPQPSLGPLRRDRRSRAPLAAALGVSVVGVGAWILLRRRKGSRPATAGTPEPRPEPPVARWVAAGESRAVAAAVAERLRSVLARREPAAGRHLDTEECIAVIQRSGSELPVRDLTQVLRELERARFAPAIPSDVVQVVRRAEELRYLLDAVSAAEEGDA